MYLYKKGHIRVSHAIPRYNVLRGRLTGLSTWVHSWLMFIAGKATKQSQQREKARRVKSGVRKPGANSESSFIGVTQAVFKSPRTSCDNTCVSCLHTKEDSVSREFNGADYVSIVCLAGSKIPDFPKERRCSAYTVLFVQQFKHSELLFPVLVNVRTLTKSPIPRQRLRALQAGHPKNTGLRMLNHLFVQVPNPDFDIRK